MSCKNIIMQGDCYPVYIKILYNGEKLNFDLIDRIQFTIGELVKYYEFDGTGEVTYDDNKEHFIFEISQDESLNMSGPQEVQIRIKFIDDVVYGKIYGNIELQYSNNKEVI